MKAALAKIAVIVVLAIGLFVPVLMIQNLVAERQQRRDEAVNGIAEGWASARRSPAHMSRCPTNAAGLR